MVPARETHSAPADACKLAPNLAGYFDFRSSEQLRLLMKFSASMLKGKSTYRSNNGKTPQPLTAQVRQESVVMASYKQNVVSSESLLLLAFVVLCGWVVVSWTLSLFR